MIELLFIKGERLKSFPFLLLFENYDHQDSASFKVGFSVPKKKFNSAVKRNRIKRMMKEAFRKADFNIHHQKHKQCIIMIIYTATETLEYNKIERGMNKILDSLLTKIENDETEN